MNSMFDVSLSYIKIYLHYKVILINFYKINSRNQIVWFDKNTKICMDALIETSIIRKFNLDIFN